MAEQVTCDACKGAGEVYIPEWKCHINCVTCNGKGTVPK